MNGSTVGSVVLVLLLCAITVGRMAAIHLPQLFSPAVAREAVRRVTGLVTLLAAIMLGFGIVAQESTFRDASHQVHRLAAEIVDLDAALIRLGPSGETPRHMLFHFTAVLLRDDFPHLDAPLMGDPATADSLQDALEDALERLGDSSPPTRLIVQPQALLHEMIQTRWAMDEHFDSSLQRWQLITLIFWLMLAFAGMGILAPRNRAMALVLALGAVAMAGAVLLLVEFDDPYRGIVSVSGQPLLEALQTLASR